MCSAHDGIQCAGNCYHSEDYLSEESGEAGSGEQDDVSLLSIPSPSQDGGSNHEECYYEVKYSVRKLDDLRRIVEIGKNCSSAQRPRLPATKSGIARSHVAPDEYQNIC